MTFDQWARVKELFEAAVERDPSSRGAFLAAACAEDAVLRAAVERLLAADEQAAAFIEPQPAPSMPDAVSHNTMTGRVIGRYEIGRLVGAGGMGEVYAAKDLELGRDVAIKVGLGADADAHARLKREAQHASRLNHPNICTIHEVGRHDDQPFIVMELVDGEPLARIVPEEGLPVTDVVRYGRQIADALAHAHRGGVTHRDLKSANVLITPDGRAKVLDFGLATTVSRETLNDVSQSHESMTAEGRVAGTLPIMAPELLRGERADVHSDIWALGVLLYEITAGERPFRGATGFELCGAILHSPPKALPERVPDELSRIILKCLEKNPGDRYQQAGDVRAALESVSDIAATARVPPSAALSPAASSRTAQFLSRGWRQRLALMLAIAVVAYGAYRVLVRPNSALVAVGVSGRPAIAVMHFQNAGAIDKETAWLSSGIPSMLVTGLAQTRGLEIVSDHRLLQALAERGKTLESLDKTEAVEVARSAGAGALVSGSIFRVGGELRIDAQLEDLTSGRVLTARTVRGTDVFALADQLASEIRGAVGFGDAPQIRAVADVSSTSLEAYRLYSEGMRAYGNARWEDADRLFKAAVAADSSFAEVYIRLSVVNAALGRQNARREYLNVAHQHADRLSERYRLFLDAQIATERGDFPTAWRLLNEIIAKFPDTEEAYTLAGVLHRRAYESHRNLDRLLAITSAGATTLPSSAETRNIHGYALLDAGRYDEAIREFEAYTRIAPREANPWDSLAAAYLVKGDAGKAAEMYARALTIDPAFGSDSLQAWSFAVLGRYDAALEHAGIMPHLRAGIVSRVGRYREAERVLEGAEVQSLKNGDGDRAGGLRFVGALLAIERHDYSRALRDSPAGEKLLTGHVAELKRLGGVLSHMLSGLAHLRAGQLQQAMAELEAQRRIADGGSDLERAWRGSLEGEIALARGELQQAESAFAAAAPPTRVFDDTYIIPTVVVNLLPSRDGLARVAIARADLDGAIAMYRALLAYGPSSKWVSPYEPLYVLQIARLLEKKGDSKAALAEYDRFLALWKNADTDLPELAEARRATARLR